MIDKEKIIWKDKKVWEIVALALLLLAILGIFLVFYFIKDLFGKLLFAIFLIVLIAFLFLRFQRRFVFINNKGIRLGNVTFKKFASIEKEQTNLFLSWNKIDTIELKRKVRTSPFGGLLLYYLTLTTKDNKKYECLLYDSEGFIQALKKLNKYYLVSKDSRYK